MKKRYVIYVVYHPYGYSIAKFNTRKEAKTFLDEKNAHVPSWHYEDLYKMKSIVMTAKD